MTTDITQTPATDDSVEHKFNRKEIIHLGFLNKTRGEAAFNAISYIGFGYFMVTAASVLSTWGLRDLGPVAKSFEKYVSKPVSKALHIDTSIMNILTLFTGGTIASVLPVKWLEDRKSKAVKKLDYMLYTEDQFYNDSKIQAAHKELDELPKQTWMTVFGSRVVAFAATFAVFFTMGGNKSPLAKKFNTSLDELSINAARKLDGILGANNPNVAKQISEAVAENIDRMSPKHGKNALSGMEVIRDRVDAAGKITGKGDRVASRVYSYIGLDAFYTVITSVSLWVSTRVFGGVLGKDAQKAQAQQQHTREKKAAHKVHGVSTTTRDAEPTDEKPPAKPEAPENKITSPTRLERVAEPQRTPELTA